MYRARVDPFWESADIFLQDAVYVDNHFGPVARKLVTSGHRRIENLARHGKYIAVLLQGIARRNERPAAFRGLNNHNARSDAGKQTVADTEAAAVDARPKGKLRDKRAARIQDAPLEFAAGRRIIDVEPASQQPDCAAGRL